MPREEDAPKWRNTTFAADAGRQRHEDDKMEDDTIAAIAQVASSEYGSDFSLPALSDYGSDVDLDDIQQDTALGDLLVKIAASAPKTVVYPSIEHSNHDADSTSGPRRRLVVQFEERAFRSSPLVARSTSLEIEHDGPSRRAFSGTYWAYAYDNMRSSPNLLTACSTH